MSKIDDIIDKLIRSLNLSLNKPIERSSSSIKNDLNHLIEEFYTENDVEDNLSSELVERIISDQDPIDMISRIEEYLTQYLDSNILKPVFEALNWLINYVYNFSSNRQPPPSTANEEQEIAESDSALKLAEEHIKNLEEQGPAGLVEVSAVSSILNKNILVWTSSTRLHKKIGENKTSDLNIQYHSQKNAPVGHWTPLNPSEPSEDEPKEEEGEEESPDIEGLNDCLFNAIAKQSGEDPAQLRAATLEKMKADVQKVAARIRALAKEKECERVVLMVGGAKYAGKGPEDAKRILDKAQMGRCHPNHLKGHPRCHASDPTKSYGDSVETCSIDTWKTAFLSYKDQDQVGHQALMTPACQNAIADLNAGGVNRAVHLPRSQLPGPLPKAAHFTDGKMGMVQSIRELVLVMRHFAGHHNDPNYDVFVHTFYPKL